MERPKPFVGWRQVGRRQADLGMAQCTCPLFLYMAGFDVTKKAKVGCQFCVQFGILLLFTGTPNRARRGESVRGCFVSQNSSVTEAPSDEVEAEPEADDEIEPARVTQ